jgi:hypothetical protein
MIRVEGVVVKIRYQLRNKDEYTANFIGKTPETITEELMANLKITPYHILERTILWDYHAISTDLLYGLFGKCEGEYMKHKKGIEKLNKSLEGKIKGFNSDVSVPYL